MTLLRQVIRAFAFLFMTLAVAPLQAMAKPFFKGRARYALARLWHRQAVAIMGVTVRKVGVDVDGPVVFLANHVSHMDISVLGGLTPARFISKQEVKNWPVFGQLAALQDTLFIDRAAKRSAIEATRAAIQSCLDEGARMIIFPEGTNTIGDRVLPFRRAALDGLSAPGYRLQPVAIHCTGVDGKCPETEADYGVYGWGDVSFAGHLWHIMGRKRLDITVEFLPPLSVSGVITGEQIEAAGTAVKAVVEKQGQEALDSRHASVAQQDRATVS